MITASLFALVLAPSVAGEATIHVRAPSYYVAGRPFPVRIEIEAPADGATVEGWQLTAAGFTVGGKALAEKGSEPALALKAGEKKGLTVDLASALSAEGDFEIAWGPQPAAKVRALAAAPKDLKFMEESSVAAGDLAKYWVLMRTNRGEMLMEFWPDVAPGHVRNFLDLSATGFYDGSTFHRVIPGFMIQGGDPEGNGTGNGPRRLKAEFNDKKHVPGVLSMARTNDPNSASCQFFVMHKTSPHLDHQYSAFGQLVTGLDTVERIVTTPRGPGDKPNTPQVIEQAIVVLAPADADAWRAPAAPAAGAGK